MLTKLPSYNFSSNTQIPLTEVCGFYSYTRAPFRHFSVCAWGASITPSSEISLYTVQKVNFDEMMVPWWSSYIFVGCVIIVRNIWTVYLSHKCWLIMSNIRWVLNFLRTLNRPDCVSAMHSFLLGTNLAGRTSSRKCWSHCSPQSF